MKMHSLGVVYAPNVFVHVNFRVYSSINEGSPLINEDTRVLTQVDRFVSVYIDKTAKVTKTGRN